MPLAGSLGKKFTGADEINAAGKPLLGKNAGIIEGRSIALSRTPLIELGRLTQILLAAPTCGQKLGKHALGFRITGQSSLVQKGIGLFFILGASKSRQCQQSESALCLGIIPGPFIKSGGFGTVLVYAKTLFIHTPKAYERHSFSGLGRFFIPLPGLCQIALYAPAFFIHLAEIDGCLHLAFCRSLRIAFHSVNGIALDKCALVKELTQTQKRRHIASVSRFFQPFNGLCFILGHTVA